MLFLRSLLVLALVIPTAVLAAPADMIAEQVTPNKAGDFSASYNKWNHPKCDPNDVTRMPETCACLDPFIQLDRRRTFGGGSNLKPCVCSDVVNAVPYVTGKIGKRKATCVCTGSFQEWKKNKDKCQCIAGYTASVNKQGKLTCTPPKPTHPHPPTPSKTKKPHHPHHQRALNAAASNDFIELAEILSCQVGEHASLNGEDWTCVADSLTSCGFEQLDCSSLTGVDVVKCDAGQCVAEGCYRLFELSTDGTCKRKDKHSVFEIQKDL